uniref:Transposase Tc1-like domain-containing protein n=1 Tax=Esox lucius TaxID=8010 RepID=A0AAY5KP04_ESOLU
MVLRELPKYQRDLIVKRYQSGERYKIISKALDIPWNTVKTVIVKVRKYGTTETLPRTKHPTKMYEKTRRKLVREASKRPIASTGCVLHVTTISCILHMNGLWGRVARRKPFLTKKNIQAWLKFAKTNIKSPKSMWENVLWSDETKVELLAIIPKGMFGVKTTLHITQRTPYPQSRMVVAESCFGAVFHLSA